MSNGLLAKVPGQIKAAHNTHKKRDPLVMAWQSGDMDAFAANLFVVCPKGSLTYKIGRGISKLNDVRATSLVNLFLACSGDKKFQRIFKNAEQNIVSNEVFNLLLVARDYLFRSLVTDICDGFDAKPSHAEKAKLMRALVKCKVDLNVPLNSKNHYPIHLALLSEPEYRADIFELMVRLGANPQTPHRQASYSSGGKKVLHERSVYRMLVESGCPGQAQYYQSFMLDRGIAVDTALSPDKEYVHFRKLDVPGKLPTSKNVVTGNGRLIRTSPSATHEAADNRPVGKNAWNRENSQQPRKKSSRPPILPPSSVKRGLKVKAENLLRKDREK